MTKTSPARMKRCRKCGEEKPATTEHFYANKTITSDGFENTCRICRLQAARERYQNPLPPELPCPDGHKRCSCCGEIRSLEVFKKNSSKRGGHEAQCKVCDKIYRENHREQVSARNKAYREKHPELIARHRQYHAANRATRNAQSRHWRSANSDRVKAYNEQYQRDNRAEILERWRLYRGRNRNILRERDKARRKKNARKKNQQSAQWRQANPNYMSSHRATYPDRYRAYGHNRRARIMANGGTFTDKDIAHMMHIQQGHCAYCGRVGQKLTVDHIISIFQGGSNDTWNLCLACGSCNSSKGGRTPWEWEAAGRWFDPPNA